jgi:hypothetical protein
MKRGSLLPGLLVAALPCASWAAEAHSTRQRYALTGQAAADFQIPADMTPQRTLPLRAAGLVAERYQQRFGSCAARPGRDAPWPRSARGTWTSRPPTPSG